MEKEFIDFIRPILNAIHKPKKAISWMDNKQFYYWYVGTDGELLCKYKTIVVGHLHADKLVQENN